jgi:hypothetical protein
MQVTIETIERDEDRKGPSFAWRATIERGTTRIVVLSDGRAAGDFPSPGPVSALVVAGAAALDALGVVETGAVVAGATVVSGSDLRSGLAASATGQTWIVRVFPGERASLEFVAGGLRLPSNAVSVEATPRQ